MKFLADIENLYIIRLFW